MHLSVHISALLQTFARRNRGSTQVYSDLANGCLTTPLFQEPAFVINHEDSRRQDKT